MKMVLMERDCASQDLVVMLLTDEVMRSRTVSLGGGARKAIEKSCVWTGDEGVTMMAGKRDFSVMEGRERSRGAGIRV